MTEKDVMVGDYLRVNRDGICIPKGTIVRVLEIDSENTFREKGLKGSAHCETMDDTWLSGGIWCDYLDPIPLTAEILEKNFNKKTFYGIFDDYFDFDIREYSDGIYIVTYHCCEMNLPDQCIILSFVHELQHFLNHCGILKEIVL